MGEPSFERSSASETIENVLRVMERGEKEASEGIASWTDNLLRLDALYKTIEPSEEMERLYAETRSGYLAQIDTLMRAAEALEAEKKSVQSL